MTHYIDGFVLPVPRRHLGDYKQLVEAIAVIWREHGALEYREYVGEDLSSNGTRGFTELSGAAVDEVVIFGWVVFESREVRDRANASVSTDPRMSGLIDSFGAGFDAKRMAYGGFEKFVMSHDAQDTRD